MGHLNLYALLAGAVLSIQVLALTDEDIARIAKRERQETTADRHTDPHTAPQDDADSQGQGQGRAVTRGPETKQPSDVPTNHILPHPRSQKGAAASDHLSAAVTEPDVDDGLAEARSLRLLGVPVAVGPNVTKFVYAQVPGESADDGGGDDSRFYQVFGDRKNGTAWEFDEEEAAALLCGGLRKDGEEPPSCLASLSVALASR